MIAGGAVRPDATKAPRTGNSRKFSIIALIRDVAPDIQELESFWNRQNWNQFRLQVREGGRDIFRADWVEVLLVHQGASPILEAFISRMNRLERRSFMKSVSSVSASPHRMIAEASESAGAAALAIWDPEIDYADDYFLFNVKTPKESFRIHWDSEADSQGLIVNLRAHAEILKSFPDFESMISISGAKPGVIEEAWKEIHEKHRLYRGRIRLSVRHGGKLRDADKGALTVGAVRGFQQVEFEDFLNPKFLPLRDIRKGIVYICENDMNLESFADKIMERFNPEWVFGWEFLVINTAERCEMAELIGKINGRYSLNDHFNPLSLFSIPGVSSHIHLKDLIVDLVRADDLLIFDARIEKELGSV